MPLKYFQPLGGVDAPADPPSLPLLLSMFTCPCVLMGETRHECNNKAPSVCVCASVPLLCSLFVCRSTPPQGSVGVMGGTTP